MKKDNIKAEKTEEGRLFSKEDLRKLIIPLLFEQALAITVGHLRRSTWAMPFSMQMAS